MIKITQKDAIRGMIMGTAVGDALGVPVEFVSRENLKKDPVRDMRSGGPHGQPAGTWSDDTSLTLCTIESLCRGYDLNDMAKRFVAWYVDGACSPHGHAFDIGFTTLRAIQNLINGKSPRESGERDERSNGNGSLMRIAPLIFYTYSMGIEDRMKIVHEVSSITHAHPRSLIACGFFVDLGINILRGMSREAAYHRTTKFIQEYYSFAPFADELKHFKRIIDGEIWHLEEREIKSTGYVVHTLESALWSFISAKNFEEAVLKSVNLGEDTDTTGAVTGAISGLYFGYEAIPKSWREKIARKDELIALADKYANVLGIID